MTALFVLWWSGVVTLEQQREQLIEQIKAAFAYKRGSGHRAFVRSLALSEPRKRHRYEYQYNHERFATAFGGKAWDEVLRTDDVILYLINGEYLATLSEDAFVYYLPTLLLGALERPGAFYLIRSWHEQVVEIFNRLTESQLVALGSFLQFKVHVIRSERRIYQSSYDVDAMESLHAEILLHLADRDQKALKKQRRKAKKGAKPQPKQKVDEDV